jgi:hypothetical protein
VKFAIEDADGASHRPLSSYLEEHMFITIRRYSPKNGSINKASLELLRRQIQNDFLPIVQQIAGFHGYYMISVDDRELMTVSLYETQEGTAQCGRCAAEYTLRNPLIFELGQPEITDGQVLTSGAASPEPEPHLANGGPAAAAALALWLDETRGMLLSISER